MKASHSTIVPHEKKSRLLQSPEEKQKEYNPHTSLTISLQTPEIIPLAPNAAILLQMKAIVEEGWVAGNSAVPVKFLRYPCNKPSVYLKELFAIRRSSHLTIVDDRVYKATMCSEERTLRHTFFEENALEVKANVARTTPDNIMRISTSTVLIIKRKRCSSSATLQLHCRLSEFRELSTEAFGRFCPLNLLWERCRHSNALLVV